MIDSQISARPRMTHFENAADAARQIEDAPRADV